MLSIDAVIMYLFFYSFELSFQKIESSYIDLRKFFEKVPLARLNLLLKNE